MNDKSDNYTPIACEFYSILEVAILHKDSMRVVWHDEDGMTKIENLLLLDLKTRDGAEYLYARSSTGEIFEIRLDKLRDVKKI